MILTIGDLFRERLVKSLTVPTMPGLKLEHIFNEIRPYAYLYRCDAGIKLIIIQIIKKNILAVNHPR